METLHLPELKALRPGLNFTLLSAPSALRPGTLLPVCIGGEEWPAASVVVAEETPLDWDEFPDASFSRYHCGARTKVAEELRAASPGAPLFVLWFVVAGWGRET